jgi:1-acyl-sn-glycerol-3-phosphate acyltransferase
MAASIYNTGVVTPDLMLKTALHGLYGVYAAATFAVVVLLLFCPLLIVAPTLPLRRNIGRAAVRAWLLVSFIPFRVRGLEHLPAQPCIALSNHASYVDGMLVTAALPGRFTFLVQHGAASWPYVGLVIRRMGVRFVNRTAAREAALATRDLIVRLQSGESLAIFPEGTFRKPAELMAFQNGAFVIAARAGVPVVPAVLRGSRRLFGEGQKLPQWSAIDIEFFAPIVPQGVDRAAADALRDAARAVMLAHCGEADGLRTSASADRID